MPIDDIVHITIRRESQTVSRVSFATVLIAGYHTHWGANEFIREYNSSTALATMVSEGFTTDHPTYLAAQKFASQNPRPSKFKVAKLSTSWTHTVRLTPVAANTAVYNGSVNGLAWTFTSDADATLVEVCTGIAAAITALAGVTASGVSGTHVDITHDTPARLFNIAKGTGAGAYEFEDITAATNVASELAALRLLDDAWYGLVLDNNSSPRILATAAYVETIRAIFMTNSADSQILNPGNTADIVSQLKDLSYARTAVLYHPDYNSFAGGAWISAVLPFDAGGATFAFKRLAGVPVSKLSATAQGAIAVKKGNFYIAVAGAPGTRWGVTASGEYIDTTISIDWLHARWGERLFALLSSVPKLPYTDASVVKVKAELGAVNGIAVRQGVLADDPAPTVTAPKVADVDPIDRANRLLPDVQVTGRLAGAIHEINVTASLSV